jgi:HSP20 family protein
MALTQWNPLSEFVSLREAMDRLFNESLVRPSGQLGRAVGSQAYDLYESEDQIGCRFAVPGVRPEDVEVTVNRGVLTVKGRYPQASDEQAGWTWHVRGLPQGGEFTYSFSLPTVVDADRAEATFEHGILTLTLPKAEAAKPKRIQIASSAPAQAQLTQG